MAPAKGLIASGRQLAHQRPVGAGAKQQDMARGARFGVDGITGCLEGQEHLVALFAADRLLHLIHDQHHVAAALIHHLRQRLRQGGSTLFPEALQLKPEAKAHPAQLQPPDPAEPHQA